MLKRKKVRTMFGKDDPFWFGTGRVSRTVAGWLNRRRYGG